MLTMHRDGGLWNFFATEESAELSEDILFPFRAKVVSIYLEKENPAGTLSLRASPLHEFDGPETPFAGAQLLSGELAAHAPCSAAISSGVLGRLLVRSDGTTGYKKVVVVAQNLDEKRGRGY